jgi:hypothetical protein
MEIVAPQQLAGEGFLGLDQAAEHRTGVHSLLRARALSSHSMITAKQGPASPPHWSHMS